MAVKEGEQLSYINGLRGIAILLVLLVHSRRFFPIGPWLTPWFFDSTAAGERGVQLFFMVSAFTLYSSYQRRLNEENRIFKFYLRRFFRITVFYWIVVVFVGLLKKAPTSEILLNLNCIYYYSFLPKNFEPIVMGSWSLFVEESFYLFMPLIFSRISGKMAFLLSLLFSLVAFAWRKYMPPNGPAGFAFPLNHYFCLFFGIALYFIVNQWSQRIRPSVLHIWLLNLSTPIILFFNSYKNHIQGTLALSLFFAIATLFPQTWAGRLVRQKWLGHLGIACFSIYLLHWEFWSRTSYLITPIIAKIASSGEARFLLFYVIGSSMVAILGMVTHRLLEKPLIELGRRVINGFEKPQVTIAQSNASS